MTSIFSLIVGGAAGLLKYIISTHLEFKHQQQMALMQKAGLQIEDRKRASKLRDKGISFTRRVLALMFASALTAPIFLSILYPDMTISVPQQLVERSFLDALLPWGESSKNIKYVEVKAPIIAMPIYDMCAMIIGFYFGSGGSNGK